MSAPPPAVFLSYASQDAVAAQRIAEALRASGIEVWFGKDELVGGVAWDAKIRGQIASCPLFVPVISALLGAARERVDIRKVAGPAGRALVQQQVFPVDETHPKPADHFLNALAEAFVKFHSGNLVHYFHSERGNANPDDFSRLHEHRRRQLGKVETKVLERENQIFGVLRREPDEHVEIAGRTNEAMIADGISSHDQVINPVGVERFQETGEIRVELFHRKKTGGAETRCRPAGSRAFGSARKPNHRARRRTTRPRARSGPGQNLSRERGYAPPRGMHINFAVTWRDCPAGLRPKRPMKPSIRTRAVSGGPIRVTPARARIGRRRITPALVRQ